ncbi:hypothetical protein BS47DRAFT_1282622, partial [Hydnum rufescens UP504]
KIDHLSQAVAKSRRIVVVTGAGISTSCGIPDFRSNGGLYPLTEGNKPKTQTKIRELFDINVFRDQSSAAKYYSLMAEMKRKVDISTPSPTHDFIHKLDSKGKLLRWYTQNVDGLEQRAQSTGTGGDAAASLSDGHTINKDVKVIRLHGDINHVICSLCHSVFVWEPDVMESFKQGIPPSCPHCTQLNDNRIRRGKRGISIGTLRPDIVMYGESHRHGVEIGEVSGCDMASSPDLVIILGTSLGVPGTCSLVKRFSEKLGSQGCTQSNHCLGSQGHVIFVNLTQPPSHMKPFIDYWIVGETDRWSRICERSWRSLNPKDW